MFIRHLLLSQASSQDKNFCTIHAQQGKQASVAPCSEPVTPEKMPFSCLQYRCYKSRDKNTFQKLYLPYQLWCYLSCCALLLLHSAVRPEFDVLLSQTDQGNLLLGSGHEIHPSDEWFLKTVKREKFKKIIIIARQDELLVYIKTASLTLLDLSQLTLAQN